VVEAFSGTSMLYVVPFLVPGHRARQPFLSRTTEGRTMRMLVVGLGSIGQRHVRNLRALLGSEVEIMAYRVRGLPHALTDQSKIQRESNVETKYNIRTHRDLDQALAQDPVAVFVCNPSSLHIPIALSPAQAGCHLFIEKPVSHSKRVSRATPCSPAMRRLLPA